MIKTKNVKIDDKTYTVKELTLRQLNNFFTMPLDSTIVGRIDFLLSNCIPELGDPKQFAPSELQIVVDAILEVNDSFFVQAAALQMDAAAEQMQKIVKGLSMIALQP